MTTISTGHVTLRLFSLFFLAFASLHAADRPSAAEWKPVQTAIDADAAGVEEAVRAVTLSFPAWPDGWRSLAQVQLAHHHAADAAVSAQRAVTLNSNDADAAAIAVHALGESGQDEQAYTIADRFAGSRDRDGWVNYQAAAIAQASSDLKKSQLYLSLAMARPTSIPAEFHFLDARISEQSGDLERAEASLARAVSVKSAFWDAWYQRGVIAARLAETITDSKPARARELFTQAQHHFRICTEAQPADAASWLGLGRAQVALGQMIVHEHELDGKSMLREAVQSLSHALELPPENRDVPLNLGTALLMLDKYDECLPHLEKARQLGIRDRKLDLNLILAYQKTGRVAELSILSSRLNATTPNERITLGMAQFKAQNYLPAIELLNGVLGDLGEDETRQAAVLRYIGHAQQALAEDARKHAAPDEAERWFDAARDSYLRAGSLHDYPAQHYFMAQETARSPQHGYDAGWQYLAWHNYASIDGWSAVIGNYGGVLCGDNNTGVDAMVAAWDRHPMHAGVWGGLIGFALLLSILGFIPRRVRTERVDSTHATPAPRPSAPVPVRARMPTPQPRVPTPQPHPPTPQARNTTPRPARNRTPVSERTSTEALDDVIDHQQQHPSGTESIEPANSPYQVRRSEDGETGALEKKEQQKKRHKEQHKQASRSPHPDDRRHR